MRAFIGIPVSKSIVDKCTAIGRQVEKSGIRAKTVEPKNMHITLKFLGNVDERKVKSIKRVMDTLNPSKFTARVTKVSAFPNREYIRVLWAGVESPDILELSEDLDNKLAKLGFEREKGYIPHITIARIKEKPNKRLTELIGMEINETFTVDRVQLISSKLTKRGPEYEVLYEKLFR